MPTAELSWSNNEIDYVKKLVRQTLGSGQKKPAPVFRYNPFLKNGTPFQQKIWRLISHIKPGETTTYKLLVDDTNVKDSAYVTVVVYNIPDLPVNIDLSGKNDLILKYAGKVS